MLGTMIADKKQGIGEESYDLFKCSSSSNIHIQSFLYVVYKA